MVTSAYTPPFKGFPVPRWWKGTLEDIDELLSQVTVGQVEQMGTSAGGLPIKRVSYGPVEPYHRTANLSSASGARSLKYYADKSTRTRPVIMIVGGIHAAEIEGIVAVNNLIRLLESGADGQGQSWPEITRLAAQSRLVLVPCLNVDGRKRCLPESFVGESLECLRRWNQGVAKDGTPLKWPDFKAVHPRSPQEEAFLGTGHNAAGVNLMHDDFFRPMAPETRALIDLVDQEAPDFILLLHGAASAPFHFWGTYYVPERIRELIMAFTQGVYERFSRHGCDFYGRLPYSEHEVVPETMNLTSALYHVCGGVSVLFESYQGVVRGDEAPRMTWDEILRYHMLLFEETLVFCQEQFQALIEPFC